MALALHVDITAGLVFRFALEVDEAGGTERVVFLALHGEDGHAECFWPIPLDAAPMRHARVSGQLNLLGEDGQSGDWREGGGAAKP